MPPACPAARSGCENDGAALEPPRRGRNLMDDDVLDPTTVEESPEVEDLLVEEVSIDGMCGVY